MSKQDRQGARTAPDLERKYNFGDTFAQVLGMASQANKAAEKAQKAADSAKESVEGLTQEDIFNLLTNNGENEGLFLKDGQLYINASYLTSGVIASEDGKVQIDLSGEGGMVSVGEDGSRTAMVNGELHLYDHTGVIRCSLYRPFGNAFTDYLLCFYSSNGAQAGGFGTLADNLYLAAPDSTTPENLLMNKVQWKDNGDGTYTLIGVRGG